jgi:hypothetical protein
MLLDFLIVGAQKSGTSSLRRHLAKNRDVITMSKAGELHFFDDESLDWTTPNYEAYHAKFFSLDTPNRPGNRRGESSPIYLYWRPCISRIHTYNPNIRLIVLLRNPMTRAFSHWSMESSRERDPLSFGEALRSENERCATALPLQHRTFSYLDRGRYFDQLTRIFSHFPREQVLVIKAEELFQTPELSLDRLEAFLGCPLSDRSPEHKRSGLYSTSLELVDWQWMYERLVPDIRQLEALLGWDCQDWHQPSNP